MPRVSSSTVAIAEPPAQHSAASEPKADQQLLDRVQSFATDRKRLVDLAETIIRAKLDSLNLQTWSGTNRRHFTPDEWRIFDALNWDTNRVSREASRWRHVALLQATAGTSEDRQRSEELLTAAQQKLDSRGTEIRERLQSLQAELAGLERAHADALSARDQRRSAVVQLRRHVDEDLLENHRRILKERTHAIDDEIGRTERDIEGIRVLERIQPGTPPGNADIERITQSRGLPSFLDGTKGLRQKAWLEYVAAERARLPGLLDRLRQLRTTELARVTAECDAMLDVFAR